MGHSASEENLSIWQNVQYQDRNPLIPESLNPLLGNGNFMPPKPEVALWPVALWPVTLWFSQMGVGVNPHEGLYARGL